MIPAVDPVEKSSLYPWYCHAIRGCASFRRGAKNVPDGASCAVRHESNRRPVRGHTNRLEGRTISVKRL